MGCEQASEIIAVTSQGKEQVGINILCILGKLQFGFLDRENRPVKPCGDKLHSVVPVYHARVHK